MILQDRAGGWATGTVFSDMPCLKQENGNAFRRVLQIPATGHILRSTE